MKKTFTLAALSLAIASTGAFAQDSDSATPDYTKWVGIYGMKYDADSDRPLITDVLKDGVGLGAEMGFRFDESWAARVELTALDIDYKQQFGTDRQEKGYMVGADAMYFLADDLLYVFGGVRQQDLDDSNTLAALGLGKHWDTGNNISFITEVAAYHGLDESFTDFGFKLGLAYTFGGSTPKSKPMTAAPKDSDNDGVVDSRDQCPMTPAGVKVDATGCNIDLDGDGVVNSMDQCPNTPYGTEVDAKGCKLIKDTDNDGVADEKDMCPSTPVNDKVDSDGCTVFEDKEVSMTLRILFDNNSAEVKDPMQKDIQDFAEFMKRYGKTSAIIEGHTSAPGSAAYNLKLSTLRAEAFKQVLVNDYGIDADRLKSVGYGETQLLDDSNTAEANRINRRIQIKVSDTIRVPEDR